MKKYLGAFLFTAFLFSLISVVVDFSDKVDRFVNANMSQTEIWGSYYLNFIPYINGLLWPLFALIAVIFITSRLAKNDEVISILNAGVSYGRFLRPYLISALLIAVIHYLGNHYVIPKSNQIRVKIDTQQLGKNKDKGKYKDVHIFLNPNSKLYVKNYYKRDSSANYIRIEQLDSGRLTGYIQARRMKLIERPNVWQLTDIEHRTFLDNGEENLVIDRKIKLDTVLNLTHRDFVIRKGDKDVMTSPELREFIHTKREKGAGSTRLYEIEVLRRTAEPFTLIILTLIGVAVASRKVRGGMGLHLAIGVCLGALFIFLSKFSSTFALNEAVPAIAGVWLPNTIFTLVAIILLIKAQK
jgi:lipopolysaccharide export system permease protein